MLHDKIINRQFASGKSPGKRARAYVWFNGEYYYYSVAPDKKDTLIKTCSSAAEAFREVEELNRELSKE